MDEESNASCHLFKMKTGMERRVCVPTLCSSSVFEHPLGATRRPICSAAWAVGVYEMLNVLQQPLDELKGDWGSLKWVCACGKQFYIQLSLEVQI